MNVKKGAAKAFTMIEVLVAVAILAFSATAALKLVLLAQNSLFETEKMQELLDEAQSLEVGIRLGKLSESGMSGDITWDITDKQREIMGEDFGKIVFDQQAANITIDRIKWKELTVKNKKGGEITLFLPQALQKNYRH
jgi:prepilin-type N-terminal cleavage/methylation domain-containing protein